MFTQAQLKDGFKMSSSYFSQTVTACCVVAVVAVVALTGCGATAPTQAQAQASGSGSPTAAAAPAVPTQAAAASKGETLCKREVVIGSYFPIRVCKTVEEWERDSRSIERTQDDIARGVGTATPNK
jgi:hypothetical protein